MEAIAKTKYLKGSPRKARLVIDMIRGRNVSQALAILKFTNKRAADPIAKCLSSAIANATYKAEQNNVAIDPDQLWVNTCFVDMGPTKGRRRMRPAPQGRAYREQRHYCHITISVTSDEKEKDEKALRAEAAAAKKAEGKAPAKKKAAKSEAKPKVQEVKDAEETAPVVEETAVPAAEPVQAEQADVADEKVSGVDTTPVDTTDTTPADDKQQDINEELERQ